MKKQLLLDLAIVAAWLVSVGMAVLHEQGHLFGGAINPLASIGATIDAQEQWFGVYYGEQKVGFAYTMLVPEERQGIPGFTIVDRGYLSFTLLGAPQEIDMTANAFIDADWRLQQFKASLHTEQYQLQWSGIRRGDNLMMTLATNASTITSRLRDPGGRAMVGGLSSWLAFHRLSVGQWGQLWLLSPISLKPETVHFSVRRQERFHDEWALVIETDVQGITTTTWLTPDGRVLKEESPMGWTLLQEPRDVAVDLPKDRSLGLDLLSTVAVPIDRPLEDAAQLEQLTVLIEGATADTIQMDRPAQTILPPETLPQYHAQPPEGSWCLLRIHRIIPPPNASPATKEEVPEAIRRYQRSNPLIQSDDPRILTKARQIVGERLDPWDQAVALHQWVFTTLTKRLTVGLPSALDVLASLSGDCHEHTILFTALARSLGIPTRAVAGLVYYQGQLYYHAWPEVWVRGAWVPTDPTIGQLIADVSHIGLAEADNELLLTLAQFVGKLRVHVLEVQP
jgi:hypothetical protein